MGKTYSALTEQHIQFIAEQKLFFVATAADTGTVNVSPKGGDSLRVRNANEIVWLNLTGSGNESAAHVLKNPRMTIMFCAFSGAPLILRAYGQASVLHRGDKGWDELIGLFPASIGARQLFVLSIEQVQSSCGTAVPFYDYVEDRTQLAQWTERQGQEGIHAYWEKKNQKSLDGFDTEIIRRSLID